MYFTETHNYDMDFDQRYIDRLLQERRNSSALAMELRLSCTTHRYVVSEAIIDLRYIANIYNASETTHLNINFNCP